jgi:23S rRNA pseudouridine955/2504/2580 synthase
MQPFAVKEEDDGIRLDRWFKRHFPAMSQPFLQKQLRKGAVKLDGKKVEASARIAQGQEITVAPFVLTQAVQTPDGMPALPKKATAKPRGLDERTIRETQSWVIHRDPQRIVINKPAGLSVQGGSSLKDHVDGRLDALKFDGERPKLVHRIDRDTSGILLLARTSKDATAITKAFASKDVTKVYWALVAGVPDVREGVIDMPLEKLGIGREKMEASETGKRAVTHYRVVEVLHKTMCWVELLPITGRTHQLRVHMALIGHPIIGDGKYGGKAAFLDDMEVAKQVHLHARRLILPAGAGVKALDITAPLPPHMVHSWKVLGLSKQDMGLSLADR